MFGSVQGPNFNPQNTQPPFWKYPKAVISEILPKNDITPFCRSKGSVITLRKDSRLNSFDFPIPVISSSFLKSS